MPHKASGGPFGTVITHRTYLTDARFIAVLEGDAAVLAHCASALGKPALGCMVWSQDFAYPPHLSARRSGKHAQKSSRHSPQKSESLLAKVKSSPNPYKTTLGFYPTPPSPTVNENTTHARSNEANNTPVPWPYSNAPPLDTLTPAKDRWTPIYLEHGRIEVDDAAIKWVDSKGKVCPIPVATVSALILGPGTTITHAAVKAAAQCNCPLLWLGADGLRFYAYGITPNHDNSMARIHAEAWAAPRKRNEVARRMFATAFPMCLPAAYPLSNYAAWKVDALNRSTKTLDNNTASLGKVAITPRQTEYWRTTSTARSPPRPPHTTR